MSSRPADDTTLTQVIMYPSSTWKSPEAARAAFGVHATWSDDDVDRAARGDGELGTYNGIRCVVLKQIP